MNQLKVSIIIPVYNVEPYIHQCLDSVVNQTYQNLEIIIVDDGSPDNCAAIIDEYAAKDSRIIPIHKANGGVSAARNDGIKVATGDYCYFVDSDDWMDLDAIEKMVNGTKNGKVDIVCPDVYWNDKPITVFNVPAFATKKRERIMAMQRAVFYGNCSGLRARVDANIAAPWHSMFRRSIIVDNGLFYDVRLGGLFDDGCFVLHVFEHATSVAYIHEFTYHYRILEGSITHRFRPNCFENFAKVYEAIEEFIEKYEKDEEFVRAYYARVLVYFKRSMKIRYFNASNEEDKKSEYKHFVSMVNSEPYKIALKKVNPKVFGRKMAYVYIYLLRARMTRLAWFIYQKKEVK